MAIAKDVTRDELAVNALRFLGLEIGPDRRIVTG